MVSVTVVIPCHKMVNTLGRAIDSAVQATEILVWVDGDSLYDFVHPANFDIFCTDYRVGVSTGRNNLIEETYCDWIIPLDADDELLAVPPIPTNPNEFVYGGWIEHYEDGTEATFTAPPPKMLRLKPLCHATMLFSKAQWQAVGGYDPDFFFGEDYALQCALVHHGFTPVRVDYPLYRRYVGRNERTDKAKKYWPIIQEMAKEKYPNAFN